MSVGVYVCYISRKQTQIKPFEKNIYQVKDIMERKTPKGRKVKEKAKKIIKVAFFLPRYQTSIIDTLRFRLSHDLNFFSQTWLCK